MRYKLIFVFFTLLALFVYNLDILYYIGNKFFDIEYKNFKIKKDKNLNLYSIIHKGNVYMAGIIPKKHISFYDRFFYRDADFIKWKYTAEQSYLFDYKTNNLKKVYTFYYNRDVITVEFSDSKHMQEKFRDTYDTLKNKNKKLKNLNFMCNDDNDCLAYNNYKNLEMIFETYNNQFYLYVINMNDFIIKLVFSTSKDSKEIDKIRFRLFDAINNEYIRLNK